MAQEDFTHVLNRGPLWCSESGRPAIGHRVFAAMHADMAGDTFVLACALTGGYGLRCGRLRVLRRRGCLRSWVFAGAARLPKAAAAGGYVAGGIDATTKALSVRVRWR